jgi:hypothetical protein
LFIDLSFHLSVVCPSCGKTDFTNLQSFAHHLALSHSTPFEDAALESYSVPVNNPPPLFAKGRQPILIIKPPVRPSPTTTSTPTPTSTGSYRTSKLTFEKSRPPPPPLEISGYPDYDKLNPEEQVLCSQNRLTPEQYFQVKKIFANECKRMNGLGRRAARGLVKIDVNKSGKVW